MKYLLMGLIRLYQWTISPMLGPVCRFYPSCSRYGYEAIKTHGSIKGTYLTVWRILRCNPWNAGGVDFVPPRTRRPWRLRSSGTAPEAQQTSRTECTADHSHADHVPGTKTIARGA